MTIGVLVTRESAALSLLTGANQPMGLSPAHPLEVTRTVAVLHLGCDDENGSNPLMMTQLLKEKEGRVGQKVLGNGGLRPKRDLPEVTEGGVLAYFIGESISNTKF